MNRWVWLLLIMLLEAVIFIMVDPVYCLIVAFIAVGMVIAHGGLWMFDPDYRRLFSGEVRQK